MQELVKNSFPSQLSSFEFDYSHEVKYSQLWFDEAKVKCFEYLQTANSNILIQRITFCWFICFSDWIKLFPKSKTIEFNDWSYYDYKNMHKTEEITFEGVEVENIIFTNCFFNWTEAIKKMLFDSGLALTLEKITFKGISDAKVKEEVRDMITEYNNVSGKMNVEVIK